MERRRHHVGFLALVAVVVMLGSVEGTSGEKGRHTWRPAVDPRREFGDTLPGPYEHYASMFKEATDDHVDGVTLANDNDDPNHHGPQFGYDEVVRRMAAAGYNDTYVRFPVPEQGALSIKANVTYEEYSMPLPFQKYGPYHAGHVARLHNPREHFSVQPTLGGCRVNGSSPTSVNARARGCVLATNAGFFNTHTKECLGNLVVEGDIVQAPGLANVNFGITKEGEYVVGYINQTDVAAMDFYTLVAGVVWLVRDGESFVDVSATVEDMNTQESGGGFVGLKAPRVALGHDRNGSLVIVHVEGNMGWGSGLNLDDFARLLVEQYGVWNAINLDGGGSVSFVQDGILRNYPTDHCSDAYPVGGRCERYVTTITCVHDRRIPPPNPPPSPPPPSPPPPSPPPPSPPPPPVHPVLVPAKDALSGGDIAGIVFGSILIGALLGAGGLWVGWRLQLQGGFSVSTGNGYTQILSPPTLMDDEGGQGMFTLGTGEDEGSGSGSSSFPHTLEQ